jgi:hypothetical protein
MLGAVVKTSLQESSSTGGTCNISRDQFQNLHKTLEGHILVPRSLGLIIYLQEMIRNVCCDLSSSRFVIALYKIVRTHRNSNGRRNEKIKRKVNTVPISNII